MRPKKSDEYRWVHSSALTEGMWVLDGGMLIKIDHIELKKTSFQAVVNFDNGRRLYLSLKDKLPVLVYDDNDPRFCGPDKKALEKERRQQRWLLRQLRH